MKVMVLCLISCSYVASFSIISHHVRGSTLLKQSQDNNSCLTSNGVTQENVKKTKFFSSKKPISPEMQCYAVCVMRDLVSNMTVPRNGTFDTKSFPKPEATSEIKKADPKMNPAVVMDILKECNKNANAAEKECVSTYKAATCFLEKYHKKTGVKLIQQKLIHIKKPAILQRLNSKNATQTTNAAPAGTPATTAAPATSPVPTNATAPAAAAPK